jgi:hypothetical protein
VTVLAAADDVRLTVKATNDLIPLVASPEDCARQIRPSGGVYAAAKALTVSIEFDALALGLAARYAGT